jgi:hypothetical protein|tara:strand:+ start:702 stop:875 length:174 start_codon:yes stop_codon:yes gene_type:complete
MNNSNDKISRRSFIKAFFLGGFGIFVSLFSFKTKPDKKKSINNNLPLDSVYRAREEI